MQFLQALLPIWLSLILSLSACATGDIHSGSAPAQDVQPAAHPATAAVSATGIAQSKGTQGAPAQATMTEAGNQQNSDKPVDEVLPPLDLENSAYFSFGSYALDNAAMTVIKRHAMKLNADPRLVVTLIGYTDDLGSREYNNALCQQRALAVEQALQGLGVAAKQIRISSRYGYEKSPVEPCRTDACRKRLRKVELRYQR